MNSKNSAWINIPRLPDSNGFRWWLFVLPFAALFFLFGCYWLVNGDIWWHLKTGEMIIQQRRIPFANTYTYTNPESSWIDLHWGFQVFTALIYKVYGTTGLIVTKSLLGLFTILLLVMTTRNHLPGWVAVLCWLPFLIIFSARYHVRPEMISLFLLSSTLFLLHYSGQRRWLLWILIPVQIIWVNCQGLFILQHLIIGAYLTEQFTLYVWRRNNIGHLRQVLLIFVLCLIASLVNPYGLQGALFPLELLGKMSGDLRHFFQQLAGETQGMNEFIDRYGLIGVVKNNTTLLLFASAAIVVLSQIGSSLLCRRIYPYHWCLLAGFGYLAWQMNRNGNLFALVYGYILTCNISHIIERLRKPLGSAETINDDLDEDDHPLPIIAVIKSLIFVALLLTVASTLNALASHSLQNARELPQRRYGFTEHPWYNHDAAEFVRDLPGPLNIYANQQGLGMAGVVIYHCYDPGTSPTKRLFADARLEANSLSVLKQYLEIPVLLESDPVAAETILKANQDELPILLLGNHLLLSRPILLQSLIDSPDWECVYLQIPTLQNLDKGVTIFMSAEMRQRLDVKHVSIVPLLELKR